MTQYRDLLYKAQDYSHKKLSAQGLYSTLTSFCMSITGIFYIFSFIFNRNTHELFFNQNKLLIIVILEE